MILNYTRIFLSSKYWSAVTWPREKAHHPQRIVAARSRRVSLPNPVRPPYGGVFGRVRRTHLAH